MGMINIYLIYICITYLILFILGIYYGLTYDELTKAYRYPYLYSKFEEKRIYNNPSDEGWKINLKKTFFN